MDFELRTPLELAQKLAERMKTLRLQKRWKRATLAERSGVSGSSLRRFEQTGKISLESFLKLLSALGRLDEMDELLKPPAIQTIDDLAKRKQRIPKRGSI